MKGEDDPFRDSTHLPADPKRALPYVFFGFVVPPRAPCSGERLVPTEAILTAPGRYDFEVHFESETHGTQRNLTTGKIRRIQRMQKGEAFPAWETRSDFRSVFFCIRFMNGIYFGARRKRARSKTMG